MKILFVINHLAGGGAERVFVDLLKMIDKKKYDITVLVVHDCGVYTSEVRSLVKYRSIIRDTYNGGIVRCFYRLMCRVGEALIRLLPAKCLHRWFVKEKYDIEVAYIEGQSTKIVSGAGQDVLTYAWVHTNVVKNAWASEYYRNEIEEIKSYKKFDKIKAVSQDVSQSVKDKFHLFAEVQYNILDDAGIRKKAACGTRKLRRVAKVVLISVGSMWKVKGYVRLVKAVHQLIQRNYDVQLDLIGDGDERSEIEDYIRHHNLESRINLHGFVEEPYDLLCQGDLYVCPSYIEGYSTSVTEALILGLPVLTTDCSGMNEILGNSEYGLIVANSQDGIMGGLTYLLDNPEQLSYYCRKAKERGDEFSAEKEIACLENMFSQDLKDKQR